MSNTINTQSRDWLAVLKFLDEQEENLIDELRQTNISHEASLILRGKLELIDDLRDLPKLLRQQQSD